MRNTMAKRLVTLMATLAIALAGVGVTAIAFPTKAEAKPAATAAARVAKARKAAKAKKLIGTAKAKQIALKSARLNASQVKKLRAKLDWEDGRRVYEVEFIRGKYEYEFEIDAHTGKIRDRDIDRIGW